MQESESFTSVRIRKSIENINALLQWEEMNLKKQLQDHCQDIALKAGMEMIEAEKHSYLFKLAYPKKEN